MPIVGLKTTEGIEIPWSDIDPVEDADLFMCSPATLAHLIRDQGKRTDVKIAQITASQLANGLRYMYLQATQPVYEDPRNLISAFTGTMKHDVTQISDFDKIMAEYRFVVELDGVQHSAKIDHAAEVGWDDTNQRPLWDLYDLKTGAYYAAKKYRENPLGDKAEYTWQVNLAAAIIEHRNIATIRNAYIEWYPRDVKRDQRDESIMIIPVPRFTAEETFTKYAERQDGLDNLIASNDPGPICAPEERWEREIWRGPRKGETESIRCEDYCAYSNVCLGINQDRNEWHPLDPSLGADDLATCIQEETANIPL